ncbi:hypothetical protein Q4R94_11230, partial [Morganella morganii]
YSLTKKQHINSFFVLLFRNEMISTDRRMLMIIRYSDDPQKYLILSFITLFLFYLFIPAIM